MNRIALTGVLVAALTAGLAVSAHARLATHGAASVQFTASGPAGMKITGTSSEVVVRDDGDSIAIVVPLAKLDTRMDLRNKHLREKYLETSKHPNAKLVISKAALAYPNVASGDAVGQLELHGVTKPVKLRYQVKKNGSSYAVSGGFRISIKDFGIEQPSYMGLTVKPDVDVTATFNAIDQ